MAKAPGIPWTRDHSLIALNLYCKLPFGSFDRKNPLIHEVAARMGRTASSLATRKNGLCLSSLHDAAFDSGLITLDEKWRLVLSKELKNHFPHPILEQNFVPFAGKPIQMPQKLAEPKMEFLAYHRESVFVG